MRYVMYMIEEWIGDQDPNQWGLLLRYDENGAGSPLSFDTEEAAQSVIDELIEDTGCAEDEMRVVRMTGESPR